jgi:hypothetical protein
MDVDDCPITIEFISVMICDVIAQIKNSLSTVSSVSQK